MSLTEFLIFGLATWRISSLFVNEKGPGNIFLRLREFSGIVHDEESNILMIPDKFFAGVLSCVWCCSVWVAIGLSLAWILWPPVAFRIAIIFGISAIATLIDFIHNQ